MPKNTDSNLNIDDEHNGEPSGAYQHKDYVKSSPKELKPERAVQKPLKITFAPVQDKNATTKDFFNILQKPVPISIIV